MADATSMASAEARIPTAKASQYLQQLCKHWSHKYEVTFTPQEGRIPFSNGAVCTLNATPDTLVLKVESEDPEALPRMGEVVINHLKRFAFREDLGEVRWS